MESKIDLQRMGQRARSAARTLAKVPSSAKNDALKPCGRRARNPCGRDLSCQTRRTQRRPGEKGWRTRSSAGSCSIGASCAR